MNEKEIQKKLIEEVYDWLINYAWVENNKISHTMLLHDFFKDFRKYM